MFSDKDFHVTLPLIASLIDKWNVRFRTKDLADESGFEALALVTHALHFRELYPRSVNPYASELRRVLGAMADLVLDHGIDNWGVPYPPPRKPKFDFIDLFAGIGGMRLAFQDPAVGGACVYSSEWDKHARRTYFTNFGDVPFGDITNPTIARLIPDHDILVAGFPCQAFSIAGQRRGFEDTRGTLFFHVASTLQSKKPAAFLLENVKGLVNHQSGRTLARILEVLRQELGYHVPDPQIMNARDFGVPQNRERIFIVGFESREAASRFKYPAPLASSSTTTIADIKEKSPVSSKYYLSTQYLKTLRAHRARHEAAGNGFGYEVLNDDQIANAIVVGGMGRERNLVRDNGPVDFEPKTNIKGQVNREGIRKMTPHEWARLQGFDPERFVIPVADAQAYKQFGNSVAVPAVRAVALEIKRAIGIR